jgi:hypothetical protein
VRTTPYASALYEFWDREFLRSQIANDIFQTSFNYYPFDLFLINCAEEAVMDPTNPKANMGTRLNLG